VEPGLVQRMEPNGWAALQFFVPQFVIQWAPVGGRVHVFEGDEQDALALIAELDSPSNPAPDAGSTDWQRPEQAIYNERAAELMAWIQRGDIYEVNFCQQRKASVPGFDPFTVFGAMDQKLRAPHAAFYRIGDHFALCQSPERFLLISGSTVTGEPMKGTRPRKADPAADRTLATELAEDGKERSENIMAVDVLRHDLSRVAASGTVRVEELCVVKSLPAVHQMTSTVTAELRPGLHPVDAIGSCFPPASMTGAPKRRAMELIEGAEQNPRGLYSGTLGFFTPSGDVDLNVVIRTVLYNKATGVASLTTGSALTAQCQLEQEWEECELKARSVLDALGHVG
jgi:para-aminobenzoate synthetase component I